ncbi:hypothetical protein [Porphyrobacter sp. AAP60]|uniref:hypothetical protein n=1 Tax=Porphyrobacter sp. AAP60 TaxID=1523423 RepID=UPI0006B8BA6B|nr:hypothetical protein [Porphyrobacter sp. AAP60]KPF63673.1 hypothetical protein IP79_07255 [Porphyrobacter sp. AAP60]
MTIGQQDYIPKRKGAWAASRKPQRLSEHRAFAPMLGLWGAALAGLSIMVLPASLVANVASGSGLMLLGDQAQVVLAGLAALLLGGVMYLLAGGGKREGRRSVDAPSLVAMARRQVHAIDPQRDLGSASFDEPIADVPFAPKQPVQPQPAIQEEPAIQEAPPPRALDLSEFAQLPGRNAVWVEDAPETASAAPVEMPPEPVALRSVPAAVNPSAAALARLRATPPQQLSLAEMVERFAGALHEHREVGPDKAPGRRDLAAREAALAEALKALAALTGHSGQSAAAERDEPLRDALASLQGVRGAA